MQLFQQRTMFFCSVVMDRTAPDANRSSELMPLSRAVTHIGRALVAH